MTAVPILIYWIFAIRGLFRRHTVLLWLMVLSLPFGSFAVLPSGLTAGLTLLPVSMTAVFICLQVFFLQPNGFKQFVTALLQFRLAGILFFFWLYAVGITLFAPHFFSGQILVVPMRVNGFMIAELLQPTKQNISQLCYLTISVCIVLATYQIFRKPYVMAAFPRIWLAGGMLIVASGFLDLLSGFLPLGFLLEPFRTATYSFLTEVETASGAKRVVGLMTEASSYGSVCLAFLSILYFLIPVFRATRVQRRAAIVCMLLVVMIVLSTSSATYVGLAAFTCLVAVDWVKRNARPGTARAASVRRGTYALVALIVAFSLLVLLLPSFFDPIIARVNEQIFEKVLTDSYLERSFWTRTAFEAGMSSYFLGVGVGSLRGSNIIATQFGSFGVPGCVLYYCFVARLLWARLPKRLNQREATVVRAMRWSFWPSFIVALLVGTTPDFGLVNGMQWGILLALFGTAHHGGTHSCRLTYTHLTQKT